MITVTKASAYGMTVKSCVRTVQLLEGVCEIKDDMILSLTRAETKVVDESRQETTNHRNTQDGGALDEAEKIGLDIFQNIKKQFRLELVTLSIISCISVSETQSNTSLLGHTIISVVSHVNLFRGKQPMPFLTSMQVIRKAWQCHNDDKSDTNGQNTLDQKEP